jgi:hypothetical protein
MSIYLKDGELVFANTTLTSDAIPVNPNDLVNKSYADSLVMSGPQGYQGVTGAQGQGFVVFASILVASDLNTLNYTSANIGQFVAQFGGELYVCLGSGNGNIGLDNAYKYVSDLTNEMVLIGPQGVTGPQGNTVIGPQGFQGFTGLTGPQGNSIIGPQGFQGSSSLTTIANNGSSEGNVLQYNTVSKEISYFNINLSLTELSFSPTLRDSAGGVLNTGSYAIRVGSYIQLGKLVFFQIRIAINNKTGLSPGNIIISLPINPTITANLFQSLTIGVMQNLNTTIVSSSAQIPGSLAIIDFLIRTNSSASATSLSTSAIGNTFTISVGGFYFAQ